MIELLNKIIDIMFQTSFWHFIGMLWLLSLIAGTLSNILDSILKYFSIIIRGQPITIIPKDDLKIEEKKEEEDKTN